MISDTEANLNTPYLLGRGSPYNDWLLVIQDGTNTRWLPLHGSVGDALSETIRRSESLGQFLWPSRTEEK